MPIDLLMNVDPSVVDTLRLRQELNPPYAHEIVVKHDSLEAELVGHLHDKGIGDVEYAFEHEGIRYSASLEYMENQKLSYLNGLKISVRPEGHFFRVDSYRGEYIDASLIIFQAGAIDNEWSQITFRGINSEGNKAQITWGNPSLYGKPTERSMFFSELYRSALSAAVDSLMVGSDNR